MKMEMKRPQTIPIPASGGGKTIWGADYYTPSEQMRPIASGSFGQLFLSYSDLKPGHKFAAKRITVEKNSTIELYTKREMALLQRLKKEQIRHCVRFEVAFVQASKDPNKMEYCFIFEFCEAGTLEKLMTTFGPFMEDDIKTLLRPIAEFYVDLHLAHIIHRDLKPSNVLLRKEWQPGNSHIDLCITDFGVSVELAGPYTMTMTMAGTPEYMAPEMFKSIPYAYSVDVFAFGLVLYRLLYPFEMLTNQTAQTWDAEGKLCLPKLRVLSAECFDLLYRCLHKLPECRPKFQDIISHPFFTSNQRTPLASLFNEMKGMLYIEVSAKQQNYCEPNEQEHNDPLAVSNAAFLRLATRKDS